MWKVAEYLSVSPEEAFQQEILSKWLETVAQTSTGRPMDALLFPPVASPVRRFNEYVLPVYAICDGIMLTSDALF